MKRLLFCAIFLFCSINALADEGMWMVNSISQALVRKMQAQGLELNDKEIYSEDEISLKDAIVSLDFGCTGSMISEQGLLITNHHCAYGDVHALSTDEHNYLEEGFFADVMSEEIPIKGKIAFFLRKVLDVTEEVEALTQSEAAAGRGHGSRRIGYLIEKKYKSQTGYEVSLSSMWAGSKYYLALYDVYTDLRLVAAPPVSIAAFGGDIDNWEWPQHKCDFAMYRIYTAPDGSPADYSEANIPLRPRKWLTLCCNGINPGDFTMIMGYPGRTSRYSSAAKIDYQCSLSLPISNEIRAAQMSIIKAWMDADPQIRLKYADRYFSLSNIQENNQGMVDCSRRYKVVKQVQKRERKMRKASSPLLDSLSQSYAAIKAPQRDAIYYRETLVRGSQLCTIANRLKNARRELDMDNEYAGIDLRVEKDLFRYNIECYFEHVADSLLGPYQKELKGQFGSDYDALLAEIWTDEYLTRESKLFRFMSDVNITSFNKAVDAAEGNRSVNELSRQYTRALYQHRCKQGQLQYPDANSTMRLTYGQVRSLKRDGRTLAWQTNSKEILAKEDPNSYDFSLHADWKQLLSESDAVAACFISDNDITGGNSGSPVLNSRGEIVGLAFDGNKESLASDVYWVDDFNRCVCVDIRFVLFTLDKYAHCDNIIKEISK